jgi:hypothetical protein
MPGDCCLVQVVDDKNSMIQISIDRIRQYFPGNMDILHYPVDSLDPSRYSLILLIGKLGDMNELDKLWDDNPPEDGDAFLVKTISKSPLIIGVSGVGYRGTMYAAYHLAELLEMNTALTNIDIRKTPKIKKRYVWMDLRSHGWQPRFRPTLYLRNLHELPRYGVNGVKFSMPLIVPYIRGYDELPFIYDRGKLLPRHPEIDEWKQIFKTMKRYGLDVEIFYPTITPPGYDIGDIESHYGGREGGEEGQIKLPRYEEDLKAFNKALLTKTFEYLPEIDSVELIPGEMWGGGPGRKSALYNAVRPFVYPMDNRICARILNIYLETMLEVCKKFSKTLLFHGHCYGITSEGIRASREVVFNYPEVVNLEEDYFNNMCWLHQQVLGYLPSDLRDIIHEKNRFGIQGITDAEFYGGGQLPTAIPNPMIHSAEEAVKRKAELFILRVDSCDDTVLGSLFNINEIMFLSGMAYVWDPVPDMEMLWMNWVTRRFGLKAGEILLPILKSSEEIMKKGFSLQGLDVLYGHNLYPKKWIGKMGGNYNLFGIFRKPGIPLVDKKEGDLIYSNEYNAFQAKSQSIPMKQIRANQNRAMDLTMKGLKAVEEAKMFLSMEDYRYLNDVFDDCRVVLRAVMLVSEGAYAAQIMLDNYDNIEDPQVLFDKAIEDILAYSSVVLREKGERFFGETEHPHYKPLHKSLKKIVESYKKIVESLEARLL